MTDKSIHAQSDEWNIAGNPWSVAERVSRYAPAAARGLEVRKSKRGMLRKEMKKSLKQSQKKGQAATLFKTPKHAYCRISWLDRQ